MWYVCVGVCVKCNKSELSVKFLLLATVGGWREAAGASARVLAVLQFFLVAVLFCESSFVKSIEMFSK